MIILLEINPNQRNCTMKHYQHLNKEERFYIWNALRTGSSQKEVAITLKRSPSTICREIKRNKFKSAKIKKMGVKPILPHQMPVLDSPNA